MYSETQFAALEAMCRGQAARASKEMEYALTEYWLAEPRNGSNSRNLFTHSSENCEPLWWPSELGQRLSRMTRDGRRLLELSALRGVNGLAASIALKKILVERSSGRWGLSPIQRQQGHLMKVTTIALATAFALTSTFALAQADGTAGYGSVVRLQWVLSGDGGFDKCSPHMRNTGPRRLCWRSAVGNAFGNAFLRSVYRAELPRSGFRGSQVKKQSPC